MPGPPFGILVKSSLPRIFWSSKQNGQWSVETTCRWSCFRPSQSFGRFSFSRSGGVKTYFAPSKFGRSSSSIDSSRYCGQVSAKAGSAAVARFANFVQRIFGRQMDDVYRRARHFGQRDGAMHGLGLGGGGTRERVIDRRGLSFRQRALHDHVDHAAVLGMHANQRAVFGGLRQSAENGRVVHHQHVRIRHEKLEAGHALAHHVVHVFEARAAQIGDDHVQTVIDRGAALGFLPPGVERVAHARAAGLDGEIDERGGPAECSGASSGLEIVARGGAAERHVEMGMRVDAAG